MPAHAPDGTAATDAAADPVARDAGRLLRCPECQAPGLTPKAETLACGRCGSSFPHEPAIAFASLMGRRSETPIKGDVRAWWGDLYNQLYAGHEDDLTRDGLAAELESLADLFRRRRHLAAVEMPLDGLSGQRVLEVGCGAGAHSALFAMRGADVTACDITPERALAAARKLAVIAPGQGRAYQADAENLPFVDSAFDIVYSNGVLHHSEDTARAVAEVGRVLRPGGRGVLMLYARHSATFWCNIVPRALATGDISRLPEAEWVGRATEGKPRHGRTRNPITRVYSERALRALFAGFRIVGLRKSSFQFDNFAVPRLNRLRGFVLGLFGRAPHPGGRLVYGAPYHVETGLELALGRHIGFAWNIVVEKP